MASADREPAIFPLGVPSIASPGAMLAAVLMTENRRFGLVEQALTTVVMLIVLLVLMLSAGAIHRLIGDCGASIVSRVMGMILASVATANVLAALRGSTRWVGQVAKAKPGAATSRLAWSSAALN